MGIFGGSEKEAEVTRLKEELKRVQTERKKLAAELGQERAKAEGLAGQIEQGKAELRKIKAALIKARQRQKGSVERANRFKARLGQQEP